MTTPTNEQRVAVQLKTLVDLAPAASLLNMHQNRINSAQSGGYISRFKGRGMEFDESRLYQPGDDIRCIDWRVTARSGKTHTKIFREERERPIFISVDFRAPMVFATRGVFKSVQAAKLAALIAWAAQQRGDRIGGQIFSEQGYQELKPHNGKNAVLRFFNALVKPRYGMRGNGSLEEVLTHLSQHARPGSRLYIISDFRGLSAKVENHLGRMSKHCELVLILVYDNLERVLPEKGRYRFTDEQRDVIIDSDKKRHLDYQLRFQQHRKHLQQLCQKLNLIFLECSTAQDALQVFR